MKACTQWKIAYIIRNLDWQEGKHTDETAISKIID